MTEKTGSRNIWLTAYSLILGSTGFITLAALSGAISQTDIWWCLIFALLSLAVKRSSFHVVPRISHSLVGIVDVAAILIFGPITGGWVAALSGSVYLLFNALRRGPRQRRAIVELPLLNGGLKALMALISGTVYQWVGGPLPLKDITPSTLFPLVVIFGLWFALDHLGWGIWAWIKSDADEFKQFLQSIWPTSFFVELLPLPMAALIAQVFAWAWLPFLMFAIGLIVVSVVVQRLADTQQQLQTRIKTLSTLTDTGRAIVEAQLDVNQLCELIYRQVSRIVDTSSFHLGLFEGDNLTLKVWIVAGERRSPQTFALSSGEGIVGWMRKTRQPLLVKNFAKEMDSLPAKPHYISPNPPSSAVFVPMVAGEKVIGSLTIQSFEPSTYTQDHLQTLSLMANQAAAAIANARLYERERLRARQLALVAQVSQQVAAITGLETLFRQVVHLIQETFDYYHVGIFTIDPDTKLIIFQAGTDPAVPLKDFCCAQGEGIIGWVAEQGQPLLTNDVAQESRYRFAEIWPDTQAELAVPLQVENQVVGVLDVQSDRKTAFNDDDTFILRTLADQIAVAIRNASLYHLERRRRQMAEVHRELAQALSSTIELDVLLNLVLVLLSQAIDCDAAIILLRNGDSLAVRAAQGDLIEDELMNHRFEPGESHHLDRLCQAQHPILFSNDSQISTPDLLDTLLGIEIQSGLGAPLLIQEESQGGFLLLRQTPKHFTQEDVQAAITFASQAALAIENARLYTAQQEEAWESTALLQVAEAVSSLNSLDDILSTIVRITPILVGVDGCAILLKEPEEEVFLPAQQFGLSPDKEKIFWQFRLPARALGGPENGKGSAALSVSEDLLTLLSDQNLIMLPLQSRGEVLGLMMASYDDDLLPGTDRRTNILTGIANQAALAVESDLLAREAVEQQRLTRELEVAQEIQASFLPESYPNLPGWDVAAYWEAARSVGGDFYDFLHLPNGHLGLIIADVADKGVPAALFMALSRTLVRVSALTGRGPAAALERANELILSDARSDLFVTIFYAMINPASGHMIYSSAGHNPPLLLRSDNELEILRCNGIALGVLDQIELGEKETTLHPGDLLLLYTDGITEAINAEGKEFGVERLLEEIKKVQNESAHSIIGHIDAAVKAFTAGEPPFDDMTCVIARRLVQETG